MKAKILIVAAFFLAAGGLLFWALRPGRDLSCIILITLDTTRADHLSCYGYERTTTPNLDRLASEGRRYEWAVAASSWTLPTHASLFTGLYPATHGAHYANEGKVSLSSAVRVEASGMMGHTIRWNTPGSRTFSRTTSEPRVQDARR